MRPADKGSDYNTQGGMGQQGGMMGQQVPPRIMLSNSFCVLCSFASGAETMDLHAWHENMPGIQGGGHVWWTLLCVSGCWMYERVDSACMCAHMQATCILFFGVLHHVFCIIIMCLMPAKPSNMHFVFRGVAPCLLHYYHVSDACKTTPFHLYAQLGSKPLTLASTARDMQRACRSLSNGALSCVAHAQDTGMGGSGGGGLRDYGDQVLHLLGFVMCLINATAASPDKIDMRSCALSKKPQNAAGGGEKVAHRVLASHLLCSH